MKKVIKSIVIIGLLSSFACSNDTAKSKDDKASVADDVLFIVLGKMSLYNQSETGEISLRNHHFVAEIMPKETG